jgi:spore coat protein U-like protein
MKKINFIFASTILSLASLGLIENAHAYQTRGSVEPPTDISIGGGSGGFDGAPVNDGSTVITDGNMTSSTSMNVSATVAAACNIQVFDIAFGTYNPSGSSSFPRPMELYVTCTKGTSISLRMDGGKYSDGTNRYMIHTNGVDKLKYNIFDESSTVIPISANYLTATATGSPDLFTFSANIPKNQNVSAGNYSDTLIFSIEY